MADGIYIKAIAKIHTEFPTKFGIPRQSGIVEELHGRIVFEPEYRNAEAIRGLEEFTHIWLIWNFSEAEREGWSPTVRPPRLGGNKRVGVFATRSPFRPNRLGLSAVKLDRIVYDKEQGPVIEVSGADLMDGTPVFDIKPYIPYADCKPKAAGGFTEHIEKEPLIVNIPEEIRDKIPKDIIVPLKKLLSDDPRPNYHSDKERIYGFFFAGYEVKFKVDGNNLNLIEIKKAP